MNTPIRILVIEAVPADFRLLRGHLDEQGLAATCHRVAGRSELETALAQGGWDVVFLDSDRPGRDFQETLAFLRERAPELPVVLLSGSASEDQAADLLQLGGRDFRDLYNNAVIGFYRTTPDGKILMVNPALLQILGYDSFSDLADRNLESNGFHPDYPRALFKELLDRDGEIRGFESAWLRRDGRTIHVRENCRAVRDQAGSILFYDGSVDDITERNQTEESLRESEARLRLFIEHAPAALAMFDREMRYLAVSRRWMADYDMGAADVLGQCHYDLFPGLPERWKQAHQRGLAGEIVREEEDLFVKSDGREHWSRWELRPWHRADGGIGGVLIFAENITTRKEHEREIGRLNRLYATLSQINQTIVRVRSQEELAREVSRIAIEFGGFTLAWVGRHDPRTHTITPLGSAGNAKEFVQFPRHSVDDDEDRCLCGSIMRENRLSVVNDLSEIPNMDEWKSALGRAGVRAAAVFPVRVRDSVWGVFGVYAGEPGVFRSKEIELLEEAASDIGFAIGHIESEDRRLQAEAALRRSEAHLRTLVNTLPDLVWLKDTQGAYLACNPRFEKFFGATEADILGKTDYAFVDRELADFFREHDKAAMAAGGPRMNEEEVTFASDGHRELLETTKTPMRDAEGNLIGVLGIAHDITERKRLEEEREITLRMLGLLNAPTTAHDLMRQVTVLLRDYFGCEAVGIRLREGDDFPYFETRGFPAEFVRLENSLCHDDADGNLARDADGRPVLACMCGNVLCGRFDPAQPFFTARGSFWANDTTRLLATTTSADRQADTRNRCNGAGYESVALVALRTGETTYGLIQLNDRRKNRFTSQRIALLERLADSLAIGLFLRLNRERLIESEKKHRTLFESSRDAILTVDPATNQFTSCNLAALRLFGARSESEITACGPADFSCEPLPDGRSPSEIVRESNARAMEEGVLFFEWKLRRLDGKEFAADVLLTRIESDGKPAIMANIRDITERKQAEAERERLSAAIEQAAEVVVVTDEHGTILYANPAFEKTSGYSLQEAVGRNPRILKSDRQDAAFYQQMWNTLSRGEVWHGRFTNKRKDGTFYEEIATISPVRDDSGRIVNYIANKLDVTTLNLLEAQLRQAQKMEMVGTLAGGIAHDFNNLLAVIVGNSEIALLDLPESSEAFECVMESRAAANRGAQLTRQLLAFSRKQIMRPEIIDLNQVVENLRKMLVRMIPESIRLETRAAADLGLVQADPGQIEQVVINLVVNARDAMPVGGTVTIATTTADLRDGLGADPAAVPPGRYVVLSVTDTGCGMSDEVRARVFEPFFTTKEPGKGTGLGLATVFGIIAQSNGFITVESSPGQGAAFQVFLPRIEVAAPESKRKRTARQPLVTGSGTILLVEDDEALRKHLRNALDRCGYKILVAGSGAEGLALAEANADGIDLVLTDMIMPEMGGRSLAHHLKTVAPALRVLFMSGYNDHSELEQLIQEGASFLQKPFSLDTLAKAVRKAMDGKAPRPKSA